MTYKKRIEFITWLGIAFLLGIVCVSGVRSFVRPAHGQAWQPPYCSGTNMALQYDQRGWLCVEIKATPLPAAPLPTECITANWNGTAWQCVPTNYLTANGTTAPGRR